MELQLVALVDQKSDFLQLYSKWRQVLQRLIPLSGIVYYCQEPAVSILSWPTDYEPLLMAVNFGACLSVKWSEYAVCTKRFVIVFIFFTLSDLIVFMFGSVV